MCGRYSLDIRPDFADRFMLDTVPAELQSNYNMAPGVKHPVILRQSPNHVQPMVWGLIPVWSKDGKPGVINARIETLSEKRMFAPLLQKRRCLIPATGFYEWKKTSKGSVPYYAHLESDYYFGFAGLYSIWKDTIGREVFSYTIITTEANASMQSIHDRMPVILRREDEQKWLDSSEDANMILPSIARNATDTALRVRTVTYLGNNPN